MRAPRPACPGPNRPMSRAATGLARVAKGGIAHKVPPRSAPVKPILCENLTKPGIWADAGAFGSIRLSLRTRVEIAKGGITVVGLEALGVTRLIGTGAVILTRRLP
jgi:hypothetical protein